MRDWTVIFTVLIQLSQDIINGDEIISDSYDLKEVDGVVYEADCKKITVGGENIGVYHHRVVGANGC